MCRDGKLPVPVEQLPTGTIIVKPPKEEPTGVAVYARVSSSDQRSYLDGQVARVVEFVTHKGWPVVRTVTDAGSGLNGHRPKLMKVLADPSIAIVAVEHRDRLLRLRAEYVESALAAQGRRLVVVDPEETVRDKQKGDHVISENGTTFGRWYEGEGGTSDPQFTPGRLGLSEPAIQGVRRWSKCPISSVFVS